MIRRQVAAFVEKYTPAQREAAALAYEDRKVRPARRVSELAAAGALEHNGQPLAPFKMPVNTVRDLVRDLRKRRAGLKSSELAKQPPRDAVEALRRRLVNLADRELAHEEKRKPGDVEPEKLRQLVRVVRELAALPGPADPRPPAPGQRQNGQRNGAETKGGLAGDILAAHRADTNGSATAQTDPAQTTSHPAHNDADSSARSAASDATTNDQNSESSDAPGSRVHQLVERMSSSV